MTCFSSYLALALGWILWCTLHSVLISRAVSLRLQSMLGAFQFYFRMFYNLFALLTLVVMMVATVSLRGEVVFSWQGLWQVVRLGMIGLSLWLFKDGAKQYDLGYMLGIRQVRQRRQHALLSGDEQFSRNGALGVIRHPWYLGSLLFLWSILPGYYQSSIIAAAVLSVYLVVGAWLEERKLLAEFGERYRSYQQEVSMLIPVKWLKKKLTGGR